jgi:hypothetical protein
MKKSFAFGMMLLSSSAVPLVAQSGGPPPPPNVLLISREEVKVGRAAEHSAYEAGWPAVYSKFNDPTHYLAMSSNSGPGEAWFLVGYPSFDAMEKDNDRTQANTAMASELGNLSKGDAEYITNSTAMMLRLVPELTHGSNVNLSVMRYMEVITWRVRPGHDADFMKAGAMYRDAATKGNVDRQWVMYRMVSGAPTGTYLVLRPMKSLAAFDAGAAENGAIMGALGAAGMAALDKLASDGVATATSQVFEFSPKMSYVSKEWKAANPTFWK